MSETKLKQVQEQNQAAKAQQVETQQVEQVQTAVSTYPTLQRALADPDGITPNDAKILQRTFGNQAVRRFVLQRKMTVGPVGDKYEQEADAVAKQVVQTINTPTSPPVRRQGEDDELQMKPSSSAMPSPSISTLQRHTLQREWKPARPNLPPFPFLQRQEEDELQAKGDSMLTGGELSGDLESSVQQAKSGGQPLGDGVRGSMEQAFNADFSGVKVHTDTQSDTLNRSISARAFTTGSDIFFRGGEYNPTSSAGKTLLAHELTHTIQQGAAPIQKQADDQSSQVKQGSRHNVLVRKSSYQSWAGVGKTLDAQKLTHEVQRALDTETLGTGTGGHRTSVRNLWEEYNQLENEGDYSAAKEKLKASKTALLAWKSKTLHPGKRRTIASHITAVNAELTELATLMNMTDSPATTQAIAAAFQGTIDEAWKVKARDTVSKSTSMQGTAEEKQKVRDIGQLCKNKNRNNAQAFVDQNQGLEHGTLQQAVEDLQLMLDQTAEMEAWISNNGSKWEAITLYKKLATQDDINVGTPIWNKVADALGMEAVRGQGGFGMFG